MNREQKLFVALKGLFQFVEDNFAQESYLDPDDTTEGPDGTWKSYMDLPEVDFAFDTLREYQLDEMPEV